MKSEFVQISRQSRVPEKEFYDVVHRMHESLWQQLLPMQIYTDGLSGRVAKNVITPADAPIPECTTCGACCHAWHCVSVLPAETVQPDLVWEITKTEGDEEIVVDRYMRRDGETLLCVAYKGNVGESAYCTIYEDRPTVCRIFEAGSDRCHALRRAYGFERFLTTDEMSDALDKLEARQNNAENPAIIQTAQIIREAGSGRLIINALLNDDSLVEFHRYDPAEETWMQSQFEGMTLDAARALVNPKSE